MQTSLSDASTASPRRVIVVGGGLAGMAAAAALESVGIAVTLLEARHALGGRASSFHDAATDQLLDNCQHVLLGCCTNLLDLYRRLGVADRVEFQKNVCFMDERGIAHELWAVGGLPAPLHLGPAFALFGLLTFRERLAVNRAMRAMLRLGKAGRESLETVAFGDWLDQHGQPPGLVEKFYDPVLIGALNEHTRKASAKYAIQVFQDALLAHHHGYPVGVPSCPLEALYAKHPCRDLRLGTRVSELLFADGAAIGVKLQSGETLPADAVVLATNHHAVQRWIPEALAARDARFAHLSKLDSVPILGVHLWFDRPVMQRVAVGLVKGPLQWLFRKDAEGRVLGGVISAAREWPGVPKEDALRQFEAQVRSLFPAARDAKLLRGVIVIEKRATFAPLPGVDAYRPVHGPAEGGIANLFLAGDYTRTGWPATMEGAVRSGYLAAEAVVRQVPALAAASGTPPRFLIADLPVQWLACLLGLAKGQR